VFDEWLEHKLLVKLNVFLSSAGMQMLALTKF
jgi:hypothetical protein